MTLYSVKAGEMGRGNEDGCVPWCKRWGGGERVSDKYLLAATAAVQVSYVPHKRW